MSNNIFSYWRVTVWLHWITALAVFATLGLGWVMTDTADEATRGLLFMLHKSLGITILVLTILRITWRVLHYKAHKAPHPFRWRNFLVRASHWGFYFLLLALPLSGWAISSAAQKPIVWFGVVQIPFLPLGDLYDPSTVAHQFAEIHETLAGILIVLLVLHILAALKGHYIDRTNTLRSMLPVWQKKKA